MKLSQAQQRVIDQATREIDFARTHNFYDWYRHAMNCATWSDSEIDDHMEKEGAQWNGLGGKEYELREYDNRKKGQALVMANTKTLASLERLGIIEIINEGGTYPDTIKVINY